MQIAIPHLYASVAQPLPFAASLTMRSFLCQRDQGNLLIYASTRLVAESADIVRHGGATRHDLNHGHEAEFIFEPLANPLMIHGDDRDALAATPAIIETFSDCHRLGDFEVVPTPGPRPGYLLRF
jgi:hypothetical protein